MTRVDLSALERFYAQPFEELTRDPRAAEAHLSLLEALESGALRSASRREDGSWQATPWVKTAILTAFRRTSLEVMSGPGFPFVDKSAYPPRQLDIHDGVRLVPGGSAVRRGAFVGKGVTIMPPAYINVGAYVDEGTMVDSHALVGSCAQIGKRVHLSAGCQIGGVLEPVGAAPVVVEDDAFVGGLVGLFEGILVRRGAVIASGVLVTGSTVIYDLVQQREWVREIPERAVVVPGSRPAAGPFAREKGLHLQAPVIVKYRDERTNAATTLEDALR